MTINFAKTLTIILATLTLALATLDSNAQDNTALFEAISSGRVEAVQTLLAGGTDANAQDKDGLTALFHATSENNEAMVKLLLAAGANPNDRLGEISSLKQAAFSTSITKALLDAGAEVTPDTLIVASRTVEVTKLLLAAGGKAHINTQDEIYGETALMLAAEDGNVDVLKLLLAAGADPNLETREGKTALMSAAFAGAEEGVKLLLAAGAGPSPYRQDGQTALTLAESYPEIQALLRQYGARE